jgi:endo-1,4-beta-mannosidase
MNALGASAKPIFITEYGESTADCGEECVSETVQAEHLSEMLEAVVSHPDWGVKMLSTFQLHDWGTESSDREDQFGLLREDGTPKPAYSIVRGYAQQYRG